MRAEVSEGIFPPMERTFKDALEQALTETQRSLMSVATAAGVSYEQLKSLRQGKAQRTNVDDAMKVAAAFGVTLDEFYKGQFSAQRPKIAVAGDVGAGARVDLIDAYAKGDGKFHIECPSQITANGHVAVQITGDSMAPVYEEGGILIYRRDAHDGVPSEAIGKICVCEDTDGRAWVKQVRHGSEPGVFNLLSINPAGDNLHGRGLRWAAPVRMYLPPDMVKRV